MIYRVSIKSRNTPLYLEWVGYTIIPPPIIIFFMFFMSDGNVSPFFEKGVKGANFIVFSSDWSISLEISTYKKNNYA